MEFVVVLLWTMRIILPMILFWLYLKYHSAATLRPLHDPNYQGPYRYERRLLLALKTLLDNEPAPASVEDLKMLCRPDGLFAKEKKRDKHRSGEDRAEKDERRLARRERKAREAGLRSSEDDDSCERMEVEALVNFLAFSERPPQRQFLLGVDSIAPPPPPPPPASAAIFSAVRHDSLANAKANSEAQLVLKGARRYCKAVAAKELHHQLSRTGVHVDELTYSMMIGVCMDGEDLETTSMLMTKMNDAGYTPSFEVLDRAIALHNKLKSREAENSKKTLLSRIADSSSAASNPRLESQYPVPEMPQSSALYAEAESGAMANGDMPHDPAVLSVNCRPTSGPGIVGSTEKQSRPHGRWQYSGNDSDWGQWKPVLSKNRSSKEAYSGGSDSEPWNYGGNPPLSAWGNGSTTRHRAAGNALEEQVPPPPPPFTSYYQQRQLTLPPPPPPVKPVRRTALSAQAAAFVPNSIAQTSKIPPGSWVAQQAPWVDEYNSDPDVVEHLGVQDDAKSPDMEQDNSPARPEAPDCPPLPKSLVPHPPIYQ
eukprot:gnl/MRDRNA2_/MRDRNA2_98905_c0_seq1.p1 gnl/MRDRNA2_/MRDRNA2_98905_c0~~gnl/MRDRNA2_/MRDRNA2_98905_c0_seq1.p1  ORF type:complete len:539 (-),score=111.03 gnl/MRDRNA2_/MRDRNA2_98905_c0_seq1:41-1657(-)